MGQNWPNKLRLGKKKGSDRSKNNHSSLPAANSKTIMTIGPSEVMNPNEGSMDLLPFVGIVFELGQIHLKKIHLSRKSISIQLKKNFRALEILRIDPKRPNKLYEMLSFGSS